MKLKVVCLNIWYGKLLDQTIDYLISEDADIILLQEVYNGHSQNPTWLNSFEILKQSLKNYSYSAFSPAFYAVESNINTPQGQAIFSKFEITSNQTIQFMIPYGPFHFEDWNTESAVQNSKQDFSQMPRSMQYSTIKCKEKVLNVFNLQGPWEMDGLKDTDQRLFMGNTIVQNIVNKTNVIVGGDFNLKPQTATVQNIQNHLVNAFADTLKTTFNMKRKSFEGYATSVVDMVFVSKDIKIINKTTKNVDVSDHLPLIVDLEV